MRLAKRCLRISEPDAAFAIFKRKSVFNVMLKFLQFSAKLRKQEFIAACVIRAKLGNAIRRPKDVLREMQRVHRSREARGPLAWTKRQIAENCGAGSGTAVLSRNNFN